MQRSKACLVALSLFAMAVAPSLAAAGSFGAEAFGSFSTYSMKDVNDGIAEANLSGADFTDVSTGLSGGLGLRMWANQSWMLSANWEPLRASTESTPTSEKFNVNAQSFQFSGTYFMPSATNAHYGLGAGFGYYSIGGEAEDPSGTAKVEGSGPGFHFQGVGEWSINKTWSFAGTAGYRLADIELKDANGDPVPTASGSNMTADYSGFMGRVGVVMNFPSGK
jgi:hypothetical protein